MFGIGIWDLSFLILLSLIVISSIVIFKSSKFFGRKAINRHRINKEKKLERKNEKELIKSQDKNIISNRKKNVNAIHTEKNYNHLYENGGKYQILKYQDSILKEDRGKKAFQAQDKIDKKVEKIKKQQMKKYGTDIAFEEVEPDYVRIYENDKGKKLLDKRTYIQVYDEDKSKQFENVVEAVGDNIGTTQFPTVYSVDFNKESREKPLIVSSSNEDVASVGLKYLIEEVFENGNEKVFPLVVSKKMKNTQSRRIVFNDAESLEDFYNKNYSKDSKTDEYFL